MKNIVEEQGGCDRSQAATKLLRLHYIFLELRISFKDVASSDPFT